MNFHNLITLNLQIPPKQFYFKYKNFTHLKKKSPENGIVPDQIIHLQGDEGLPRNKIINIFSLQGQQTKFRCELDMYLLFLTFITMIRRSKFYKAKCFTYNDPVALKEIPYVCSDLLQKYVFVPYIFVDFFEDIAISGSQFLEVPLQNR